jgi:hypothetical protein
MMSMRLGLSVACRHAHHFENPGAWRNREDNAATAALKRGTGFEPGRCFLELHPPAAIGAVRPR